MNGSPYRFRLERVRALREHHEDEAKMELATAMGRRAQCEELLNAASERVEGARQAQHTIGATSPEQLLARQAYLERVEQQHRSNLENLQRHEQEETSRRAELAAAAQARESLERLKAKGLAAHLREEARAESVTLDEIAINGFRRRAA